MNFTEECIPQLRRPVALAGSNMSNIESPTIAIAVGVGIGIGVGVAIGAAIGVAVHKAPVKM